MEGEKVNHQLVDHHHLHHEVRKLLELKQETKTNNLTSTSLEQEREINNLWLDHLKKVHLLILT